MPEAPKVRRLFAAIARRYDLANDVLSLGVHRLWRRRLVRSAGVRPGMTALDVCCGTGDLALALRRAGASVVGADFCPEMLVLAASKAPTAARFVVGDTLRLPFPDASFDLVTVAFGIRNVADPTAGLREMARVCRPGGRVVVLEFCRPRLPLFSSLYGFYFRKVMPRLGAMVSGDRAGAYRYLQATVAVFPERESFLALMRDAGLTEARQDVLSLGIACIYQARTAATGTPPARQVEARRQVGPGTSAERSPDVLASGWLAGAGTART